MRLTIEARLAWEYDSDDASSTESMECPLTEYHEFGFNLTEGEVYDFMAKQPTETVFIIIDASSASKVPAGELDDLT